MKRILVTLGALILIVISAILVTPGLIESRFNRTMRRPSYFPSSAAVGLHREMTIVDLHADSLLWGRNLLRSSNRGHIDVPRLVKGNVAVQIFTVVTKVPKGLNLSRNGSDTDDVTKLAIAEAWPLSSWADLKSRALYQAKRLNEMSEDSRGAFFIIRTSDDLGKFLELREKQNSVVAGIVGLEGAHALEGDVKNLDVLFDAGFRIISLTHFFDNEMAGSSTGSQKGGLTLKGRELVRRMEAKHVLIDLAHASGATIDDVTAIATKPVVVSHTGVRGTCDNERNLSDQQIRAVAKTGGLIGIGYWNTAICGTDAHAIAKAIRYVVDLAGIEHVGLGSDFDGSTVMPFDTTGVIQITDALLRERFSEREIRLIMGENSLRLLHETLP